MEAHGHDTPPQDTGENPSARGYQHHSSQEGSAQPALSSGYHPEPDPGMASSAPGPTPGMGPYGPYQGPIAYGPGPAPGMGMYGPGQAFGIPPSGPGQAPGATPHGPAYAGYQAWPHSMAGPSYPPPQWPQAPYFVPPGAQGYGPYAGQAPAEQGAGIDDLMREVANGNVGLSSLTKLLGLGDKEFWKGALIGSAVVLLLTNTSIKQALFGALGKTSETTPPSGEDV